jgi:hypothetical protein
MPASRAEQVLEALKALLDTVPDAIVERNSVLPEKIPHGGLIILRDGDPGEPEQALGGFGGTYYQHAVDIEVYVDEGDAAARDAAFDALLQEIGAAFESHPTLGGLAFGLTYGRPEISVQAGRWRTRNQGENPLSPGRSADPDHPAGQGGRDGSARLCSTIVDPWRPIARSGAGRASAQLPEVVLG